MSVTQLVLGIVFSFVLSTALVPLAIRLGLRFSLLDLPGKHKRHKTPTPILGGVALFFTIWITVGLALLIFPNTYQELSPSIFFIFAGALVILLVGLADDLSPLSAWVKLASQAAAGLLLFLGELNVELISTPYGSLDIGPFSVLITVLWVIVLTNAINLIDGLDGLASGVSLIGALVLLVIGELLQVGPVLIFVSALVGFLALFLYYNQYPAKIFLGDSGSMQIGYYFAVFSLIFPVKSYTFSALFIPVLVLGVPILETISSLVRRLVSGKNIMTADRRHLFHYLSLAGFSPRQVVSIFYSLAAVFGMFALAMFFWNRLIVFGYLVFFMVVIFALFFIIILNISPRRRQNQSGGGANGSLRKLRARLK